MYFKKKSVYLKKKIKKLKDGEVIELKKKTLKKLLSYS